MLDLRLKRRNWMLLVLGGLLICLAGLMIHDLHPEHGSAQAGCYLALHLGIDFFAVWFFPMVVIAIQAVFKQLHFRRLLLQSI